MTAVQTRNVQSWDNPAGVASRGTLIVVPGRGEHPGVYARFGTRLSFDAYQVRAVPDPTRDEAGARAAILALLDDPGLPAPKVLVGSDTGALFAVGLVVGGDVRVDALVLAGLPSRPGAEPLDWETELAERTACPTHQARLAADERVLHGALGGPVPPGWFDRAALDAADIPVLGLHGAHDTISPLDAVRPLYRSAARAELVSIAGGKHDALNDATHRSAAATVVLFLERLKLGRHLPPIATTEV